MKNLRNKFVCYIADEDNWDETIERLASGKFIDCVQSAKDELERMIEEFNEDREDYKDDLDKIESFLSSPKEELSKVTQGYKPLYIGVPLGYTISIE